MILQRKALAYRFQFVADWHLEHHPPKKPTISAVPTLGMWYTLHLNANQSILKFEIYSKIHVLSIDKHSGIPHALEKCL